MSYIAHGFGWQADYVGQLAGEKPRMDLLGWITLHNLTNSTFRDAQVQVIAGRLNLLDAEEERGTGILGNSDGFGIDDQLDYARDDDIAGDARGTRGRSRWISSISAAAIRSGRAKSRRMTSAHSPIV